MVSDETRAQTSDRYFDRHIEVPDKPDFMVYLNQQSGWMSACSVHATCFLGSWLDVIIDNGFEILFEGTSHECLSWMYERTENYFIND